MTSQNATGAPGSATIDGTFLHARDRGANRIRVGEVTDRQFDLVAEEAAGLVCIADEGRTSRPFSSSACTTAS